MSKEKVIAKPDIISLMSVKYNLDREEFMKTIRATIIKPSKDGRIATNEEVVAFLVVANKYNLDPFTNEIYAYPSKRGGIIPVVGVDGFVTQMNRNEDFNGMDIEFSEDAITMDGAKSCPEWCEVKIYRKDTEKPIVVREYLDEVYIPARGGFPGPWQTHTKRMLRHKTIIQANRIAFGITGIYDPDEAERILEAEVVGEVTKKPDVEMPQAKSQPALPEPEKKPEEEPPKKEEPKPQSGENKLSTLEQQKAIHTLATKLKMEKEIYTVLGADYGVESTKELTFAQAHELIGRLSKELGNGKK